MKIVAGVIANVMCAAIAVALIWEAEVRAYWVWPTEVQQTDLQRARQQPSNETLGAIASQHLGLSDAADRQLAPGAVIRDAERLLRGEVRFGRQPPANIAVPFQVSNLESGTPTHQLYIAALAPADLLLKAYRASGEDRFLLAAQADLVSFARFDEFAWISRGLLWNDHALANGISVLADYWMLVRNRRDLDLGVARAVLSLASRTAERLAKPGFFTYRTNHGVMQSVALLQYAAAFPSLANADHYRELACARLVDQLRYYVSPEGPILEHSAGYHEFGRYLLDLAVQLSERSNCAVPDDWRSRLARARGFSALLRRPDGSLPVFGNTDGASKQVVPSDGVPTKPPQASTVFPVSGYAVWWSGLKGWPKTDGLAQTVALWSNFPTRAHKHADDMSVLVWANGHSWLRNIGYWPYGARGFREAQGWRGSNAPHFVDESSAVVPAGRLNGAADVARLRAIELARRTADGQATLRRQVVELDGQTWLVADAVTSNRPGRVERLWSTSPGIECVPIDDRRFLLRANGDNGAARLAFVGDLAANPSQHRGELEPFAGWGVDDGLPLPATAISVVQDSRASVVFSILETGEEGALRSRPPPSLSIGSSVDAWQVTVHTTSGPVPVSWASGSIVAAFPQGTVSTQLTPAEESAVAVRNDLVTAYQRMTQRYNRFRELTHYRYQLTGYVLVLFALQEALLLAFRRWASVSTSALRTLASGAWLILGTYLAYGYLQ